jgi:PAS domain S-box-containing protein
VELSHEAISAVIDSVVDTGIITLDAEGLVRSWNSGATRLLGWTEAEMRGQSVERLFTEEDRANGVVAMELRDAHTRGRGGQEGWRIRKDGERIWVIGETAPIRSGGVEGFVKIVRDRTDWKRADEALREETRIVSILQKAGTALTREQDLERLVQAVTDAGAELTGAEYGAFFYNVLDESGESYMLYTLSGAPRASFEAFPMPRNTPLFAPTFNGEATVRSDDITLDLRYGQNPPRSGMPEGHLPVRSYLAVPVFSRSGEVLGALLFGHSRPGVFGERSERGLSSLAAEAGVAIDNARLALERRRAEEALRRLNATLEEEVAARTRELQSKDDVLRQSQKMEAVGQLTGGIAHDFNNLLQIIIGNLETLQRNLPAEAIRLNRAAGSAMNGARRAAALTQRLLAFSRRQPLDPKPVAANGLVSGLADLLQRTLGEAIAIETVNGAGLWTVEVDPNELEAALVNLAVNARDAMPQGGRLTIETTNAHIDEAYAASHLEVEPGQYVAISVSDTGVGMDARTLSQVFEPFFTTKPVGKGTGLGLSQVYGFVKQSGGHVKIYSELGQGTTVKLYLPRHAGEAGAATAEADCLAPEGAAETILVVEDDEDVRTYSTESLRDLGYRVLEAPDGPSALRHLAREPKLDLLFTDVILPGGMTGAQVAAKAKEERPDLKVLFTTGYARNAIVHRGRLDKGVDLITKPFSFPDLAAKVRDVLDR